MLSCNERYSKKQQTKRSLKSIYFILAKGEWNPQGEATETEIPLQRLHLEAQKNGRVRGETAHVTGGETSKGNGERESVL